MNKLTITALLSLSLLAALSLPVTCQIEQGRKARQRMDESVRATEEIERKRREAMEGEAPPVPRAAVINVDVQGVLSAQNLKSFAEAKLRPAVRLKDGENLWLYLKFKTKLGDYVLTTRDADDPTKVHFTLFAEIGPKGDVTALQQYVLRFVKEDLAATELKINLAPGLAGRNRSIPLFLDAAGSSKPGVWTSEIRISNAAAIPRDYLATTAVALDLQGGNAKFRKMMAEYDSMVLRGTTDLTVMPIAGTFYDAAVRDAVLAKLSTEKLSATNFYFAGDQWAEQLGSTMSPRRARRVFGVATYNRAAGCFYAVAEVVQKFDYLNDRFGASEVTLAKDLPLPCAK